LHNILSASCGSVARERPPRAPVPLSAVSSIRRSRMPPNLPAGEPKKQSSKEPRNRAVMGTRVSQGHSEGMRFCVRLPPLSDRSHCCSPSSTLNISAKLNSVSLSHRGRQAHQDCQ
jgi:hypothetical protein